MKKITALLIASGVVCLFGASAFGQAGGMTIIDPDTMHYRNAFMIDPMSAAAYMGDFTDGLTVNDIDPATLLVNSSISPTSWSILPSHPDFNGEVMEIMFPVRDFILGYGLLWDTSVQIYTISGQFINGRSDFSIDGEVTMIGHTSGDVNSDGIVNMGDLTYLLEFLFRGGARPPVMETADIDHSGFVNIADVTALVKFLFR